MSLGGALRALLRPASVRQDRASLGERLRDVDERLRKLAPDQLATLRAQAAALEPLRRAIAEKTGTPSACRTCATRQPSPHPAFPGGFCCGGGTERVHSRVELVPLRLRQRPLLDAPLTTLHHGCIFRTPERGCTLDPVERPAVCLAYICTELRAELGPQGRLAELEVLAEALRGRVNALERALAAASDERSFSDGPGRMRCAQSSPSPRG